MVGKGSNFMDPVIIITAGIEGAKTIGKMAATGVKAVYTAGGVVNNWLKEVMPLENRSAQPTGEAEFPPLRVQVSENLGKKIKLLENTAQALGTTDAHTVVKGIIDQINEKTFNVLIVGRYTTGKSALLNKLLEREILKTGVGETTKTLAWLWCGEKELAWYHDYENNLHAIELKEIVNIPENPPVFNVFASVHAEILNHGAVLIDPPGLEASDEAAALTNKAMENADAVILVVDDYPVEKHDKQLVEKLQREGKTGKLFVVINKMDKVDPAERDGLIEDRIKLFSDMGVRARIFPLSCEDLSAADNGFARFRKALVEYIDKDLQAAKDESVLQRIKNTAADFSKECETVAEFSKIKDEQVRATRREAALDNIEKAKQKVRDVIHTNKAEIRRLENSMLAEWDITLSSLKNYVHVNIQNASKVQLDNLNQLFGEVQAKISRFLLNGFSDAEEEIQKSVIKELNSISPPMLQAEGQMVINTRDPFGNIVSKIDPRFGTFGVLAFTFFTKCHGFFSTVFCLPNLFLIFVLGPFINKIFEQVLKVVDGVNSASFKTKLQEEINKQWPDIDLKVREKINAFFKAISDQMEHSGDETIKTVFDDECKRIALADSISNGERAAEIENFNKELKILSNQ
jgi:small GTP-binding protein